VAAFSQDQLQYSETLDDWRTHDGIDISAAAGTKVLAASAGTVLEVTNDELMGTTVVLSHSGGYQTTYANLQKKPLVSKGDTVSSGQVLGLVGETSLAEAAEGPHLHFSVAKNGDAVDPDDFLRR
jgi:murein DD-endopeptidase MepM/ murein hydrolase activator NlpD